MRVQKPSIESNKVTVLKAGQQPSISKYLSVLDFYTYFDYLFYFKNKSYKNKYNMIYYIM
jgi:hypothetical protein